MSTATTILQFKITLKYSRPPIWRRTKYNLGWYSPTMRVIRNTAKGKFPSFLGIFSSKRKG